MKIKILPIIFILLILTASTGIIIKIQHWAGAELLLAITALLQIVFALCSLYEIKHSDKIGKGQYFLWEIGLLALAIPTGLIYMLSARKRILSQ